MDGTREQLIKMLNRRISSEMRTKWVEEAVQDLSKEEMDKLFGDQPREFESADKEFQFLARKIVMKAFQPIRQAIVRNRFLSINAQFVHMLRSLPYIIDLAKYNISKDDWKASVARAVDRIKKGKMTLSNVSAYLYLFDKMTGKKGERDIRYVFIDEVQDYTPFQLAFLKFSFPRARFTLLGDLNQAIFTKENSHTLLSELSTMFDPEKTRVVQLTQSYRSTQQITDFTRHILVNGEAVTAFDREGQLPNVTLAADEQGALQALIKQVDQNNQDKETTAIIGKTLKQCRALAKQLKEAGVRATLIQSENQRLASGVIIVPSFLAKGLEFDAVIVWEASDENYFEEDDRQLLYTICSRAMHRLTVLADGKLSRLLETIPAEEYILNK